MWQVEFVKMVAVLGHFDLYVYKINKKQIIIQSNSTA